MPSHTSAPWNPYSTFAHLVENSGGSGIHLSPEDYGFAAHCINAHERLVEIARQGLALSTRHGFVSSREWEAFGLECQETLIKLARGDA